VGNCEVTSDKHNAGRSSIQFFLTRKGIVIIIIIIQRKWNMTANAITITIMTTGVISKSLKQYLRNISGKQEITELQKNRLCWALDTQYGKR
jgi:hypothetical protein